MPRKFDTAVVTIGIDPGKLESSPDERSDIRDSLCICYSTRISLRSCGLPLLP
jgi:hypothetical protein